MCGIVGMSFRRGIKQRRGQIGNLRNCFTRMLINAQIRGAAATGIMLVSEGYEGSKPKMYVLRSPLPAEDFVKTSDYAKVLSKLDETTLSVIGHTRAVSAATARNNHNNHPFVCGDIVGVHNGMVINDNILWRYSPEMGKLKRSNCDSEVIFALTNHLRTTVFPIEDAIAKALAGTEGWYALAMVSLKEPHRVFIIKDSVSDMEVAWWKAGQVAMFGSEYSHISLAFNRAGLASPLKRYRLETGVLTTLDSTIGGKQGEFFVQTNRLENTQSLLKTAHIIERNKEKFKITQGKGT